MLRLQDYEKAHNNIINQAIAHIEMQIKLQLLFNALQSNVYTEKAWGRSSLV